jgi:hypothetical protein
MRLKQVYSRLRIETIEFSDSWNELEMKLSYYFPDLRISCLKSDLLQILINFASDEVDSSDEFFEFLPRKNKLEFL